MKSATTKLLILLGLILQSGCDRSPQQTTPAKPPIRKNAAKPARRSPIQFTVLPNSSVDFVFHNGEEQDQFTILESLGGGVGLIDFDNDGRLDICLPGGGTITDQATCGGLPTGLFRQRQGLEFVSAAQDAGLSAPEFYSHGVAATDFDNDGFVDVCVTGFQGIQLFHNSGDGTFENIATLAGLSRNGWSASGAWGDLNEDGNPDLYLANYVDWSDKNNPVCRGHGAPRDVCPPRRFESIPDQLYFSQGDFTFEDVSDRLNGQGKGLGVVIADLDGDARPDIYVCNDTVPNLLFHNDGSKFVELGMRSGTAINDRGLPDGSMGVDLLDYNLDGLPDLWVSNFENESFAVYRNRGQGTFLHSSQSTGVTAAGANAVGWGTVAFDIEHDGDDDVFVANGHVQRFPHNATLAQRPFLFVNTNGRFQNVAEGAQGYLSELHRGRGCARGDLDRDGDTDLVVSNVNEPVAVLLNESESGNWISLKLVGRTNARDAIGSKVVVSSQSHVSTKQLCGGGSYASANSQTLDFGLGKDSVVDSIEIHWPGGVKQRLEDVVINQHYIVVEGRLLPTPSG